MAHDVFISYSSEDKPIADAVCAKLEARRIRCWIALRDVLPGRRFGHAIAQAIGASRVVVLVFSASANRSEWVSRELERAVHHALPILPLRVEDVTPSGEMELLLAGQHWLDALTPPLEQHLRKLADAVSALLGLPRTPGEEGTIARDDIAQPAARVPPRQPRKRRWALLAAGVVVAALIVAVPTLVMRLAGRKRPAVLPAFKPPVTSRDIEALRAKAVLLAGECTQDPSAVDVRRTELEVLAEKASSDPRYREDAPGETAAIYRLYAAALLFTPTGKGDRDRLKEGLSWLRRLRALNPTLQKDDDLRRADEFFSQFVDGRTAGLDPDQAMRHVVRLALLGGSEEDVEKHARQIVERAKRQGIP